MPNKCIPLNYDVEGFTIDKGILISAVAEVSCSIAPFGVIDLLDIIEIRQAGYVNVT